MERWAQRAAPGMGDRPETGRPVGHHTQTLPFCLHSMQTLCDGITGRRPTR